jgi:carbamoyl-phosphate synthase large subunit
MRILITGCGSPGIAGTIYSLRNNYDNRKVYLIGTDIKDNVVGKYLCDEFHLIPPAFDGDYYLECLLDLAVRKRVNVILPQNTAELWLLAANRNEFEIAGIKIVVSNPASIALANNKYKLMNICLSAGIPIPYFCKIYNFKQLKEYAVEFGWPKKKIVIKPLVSNGQRGFRIIDENINLKKMFYEEKPTNVFTNMDSLFKILGKKFPPLLLTEYLPGEEYTVDVFRNKQITAIPRKRILIRSGITFNCKVEKNEQIIKYSKKLAELLDLKYCFGFQFKMDENGIPKILEANPRVQGTMITSTFAGANILYSAVKAVMGEKIPSFNIDWNTKLIRYWGALNVRNNGVFDKV